MDLNSRRILDPADAERLALIDDTDEIADTVAEFLGLVILRPDDYVPKKVVSYVYLWINFTRLRAGAVPFLYIGSRRNSGDPLGDDYLSSSEILQPDIKKGDDCRRYILEVLEVDPENDAYDLEEVILTEIDCRASVEFYNLYNGGRGHTSETASAIMKANWQDPDFRVKMSEKTKARMSKQWQDPDFRVKMSKKRKEQWQDPDFRVNISKKRKEQWQDPDFRIKMSEKTKVQMSKQWQDPDFRAKQSDGVKKSWQDPDFRARMLQARHNPQMAAHISYYDEWSRRADSHDFEHCDACGKEIAVEPIRASQKITCFFCENPVQDVRN